MRQPDSILGSVQKDKDIVEARQELQCMEERDALHPQQRDNGREYLSPASYTLSKEEKETIWILIQYKRNLKFGREEIYKSQVP